MTENLNNIVANTEYITCICCNQNKERITIGMYPNGKDKIYVNRDMFKWNGRVCPDCHRNKVRVKTKIKRHKDKAFRERRNAKRREVYRLTGK